MTDKKYIQNLHQHTTFCDGKDTVREVIEKAIEKGFYSVGFSGHSYMFYSKGHSMSIEGTEKYKEEIAFFKKQYADKIKIYTGLELDMYSQIDLSGYDYIIGSMHYFKIGGEYVGFDRSQSEVRRVIDTYFEGDGMKYALRYYDEIKKLSIYKGKIDILGHYDLITKHADNITFFDTNSKIYRNAATETLEYLSEFIPFFEVNTGAVARGYRKTPYPQPFLIREMKRLGMKPIITSDCHDASMIDCEFEASRDLLIECGFSERYILTDDGFMAVELTER